MPTTTSLVSIKDCIPYDPFWAPLWEAPYNVQLLLDQVDHDLATRQYQPSSPLLFHFLTQRKPNVIILGQDPYYVPGKATGRAFEMAGLKDWHKLNDQRDSLANIYVALYRTYCRLHRLPLNRGSTPLAGALNDPAFQLAAPTSLFDSWEEQGVLLLNTALTVGDFAGSHVPIWTPFTNAVIRYLGAAVPDAQWLLWGNTAKAYTFLLPRNATTMTARHPSPWNNGRDDYFGDITHFYDTRHLVDWFGGMKPNSDNPPAPVRSRTVTPRFAGRRG